MGSQSVTERIPTGSQAHSGPERPPSGVVAVEDQKGRSHSHDKGLHWVVLALPVMTAGAV